MLHFDDIVIADNLRAHKGDGIEELVASVGAIIVYLPLFLSKMLWVGLLT